MRFDQTLYYNVNGSFRSTAAAPTTSVRTISTRIILLGLPNTYAQGSAQHENVRSTALYLFAQDSWKIRPNLTLELWPALGTGHAAHRHRPSRADLPSRPGDQDLSLPALARQPAGAAVRIHRLQPERSRQCRLPARPGVSRRHGNSERHDPDLLQSLRAAHRPGLEPIGGLRLLAQAVGRARERPASAPAGASSTIPSSNWCWSNSAPSLPSAAAPALANTMFNTPFVGQDGTMSSESVQRHPESAARPGRRLVGVPPDPAVRPVPAEHAHAVFRAV